MVEVLKSSPLLGAASPGAPWPASLLPVVIGGVVGGMLGGVLVGGLLGGVVGGVVGGFAGVVVVPPWLPLLR
jgi:predicted lipid-binding transport protein (Tim44 family)